MFINRAERGICYFYYRNEHQIFLVAGIPVAPSMPSMAIGTAKCYKRSENDSGLAKEAVSYGSLFYWLLFLSNEAIEDEAV